ncbi:hypothetical protein RRG08_066082 [Elysia crispata]|uniref:Uncharacterized protein n=1 Tax=Elysia crispata TaxID=231223 RepID=A0AAE0YE63_9GAST|nr:hypothetical protein RRG08_066082 [Elysia crispata]
MLLISMMMMVDADDVVGGSCHGVDVADNRTVNVADAVATSSILAVPVDLCILFTSPDPLDLPMSRD